MTPTANLAGGANLLKKLDRPENPDKINSVNITLSKHIKGGIIMKETLVEHSKPFLTYLEQWKSTLNTLQIEEITGEPEKNSDYLRRFN